MASIVGFVMNSIQKGPFCAAWWIVLRTLLCALYLGLITDSIMAFVVGSTMAFTMGSDIGPIMDCTGVYRGLSCRLPCGPYGGLYYGLYCG